MAYTFKSLEGLVSEIEHQAAIYRKRQRRLNTLAEEYLKHECPWQQLAEVRRNGGIGAVRRTSDMAGATAAAYEQTLEYLKGLEAL